MNDDIEGWGLKTIYSMVTIVKTRVAILCFYITTKPVEWQLAK